jgi:hypothetical protein
VRRKTGINALDAIFGVSKLLTTVFVTRSSIPTRATALSILRQLEKAGILKILRKQSGTHSARYCFGELINLIEGREIV